MYHFTYTIVTNGTPASIVSRSVFRPVWIKFLNFWYLRKITKKMVRINRFYLRNLSPIAIFKILLRLWLCKLTKKLCLAAFKPGLYYRPISNCFFTVYYVLDCCTPPVLLLGIYLVIIKWQRGFENWNVKFRI